MNSYSFRARALPVVLVLFPAFLSLYVLYPIDFSSLESLAKLVGIGVVGFFLSQIGRDQGKRLERSLWESWGGAPTTLLLRHSSEENEVLLKQRHKALETLTGAKLPSKNAELKDPKTADEKYAFCVSKLRSLTRDKKRFHLIFEENVNYGFRRNLVGMRSVGITISLLSLGVCIATPVLRDSSPNLVEVLSSIVCASLFSLWLLRFRKEWVKIAAFAYAERLLESVDTLIPR